ncbi:aBC transporter ATP-binding protein [Clostridium sp. CAG:242]|nr:aBC transporter ATP-binding protein [Clostridium sp. CAG:242]
MAAIIKIENLYKIYPVGKEKVVALGGINLEIPKGQICCILGTSGSGKSTLLNQLAGLEKPTKGRVLIGGVNVSALSEGQLAKFRQKNVGFIFQSYNLLQSYSALENVAMPLMFRGIGKGLRNRRAKVILKQVGLGKRMHHKPAQMSGGQQQRVGIARAFVAKPKIVFADEPTGNLDTKTTKEVMELMVRLCRKNNQTLVLVTHDRELALYADRIITLIDGKVVDDRENRSIAEISEEPSASSETAALPENTSASKALQSSQDDEMAQVVNALLPDDLQEQPKQPGKVVDEKPEEMEEKQEITDQEREDEEKQ